MLLLSELNITTKDILQLHECIITARRKQYILTQYVSQEPLHLCSSDATIKLLSLC